MNLRTRDFARECIIFYDHELIMSNTTSITHCLYIHTLKMVFTKEGTEAEAPYNSTF
jgi:hypothetical protein